MDIPKDGRRIHNKPMPRFGGLAIYVGMMIALAIFAMHYRGVTAAMVGCTIIYILGAVDDLKNLKPIVKFAGQWLAATVTFVMGLRIEFITNLFGEGKFDFRRFAF